MDVIFYAGPVLIMALALFMAYRMVRGWLQIRGAWNSGLTAEGRRTTLRHVYEFITHDGRVIRFEEDGGPGRTPDGDYVTVYYAAGRQVVATAQAPSRARHVMAVVGILAFLGVVVVCCAGFVVTYAQIFAPYSDFVFGGGGDATVMP
ncbi:hypothetical protein [Streptomyces sp. NPDC055506]